MSKYTFEISDLKLNKDGIISLLDEALYDQLYKNKQHIKCLNDTFQYLNNTLDIVKNKLLKLNNTKLTITVNYPHFSSNINAPKFVLNKKIKFLCCYYKPEYECAYEEELILNKVFKGIELYLDKKFDKYPFSLKLFIDNLNIKLINIEEN